MAELLSVQVHVPVTKGEDGRLLDKRTLSSAGFRRLKKVENAASDGQQKFSNYMPKRKAVDIEFRALTYSVSEGRKKGECSILYIYFLVW